MEKVCTSTNRQNITYVTDVTKTYPVSATGLCLKVTVKNTDTSACVTLFNNLAERFSGKAARDIERETISLIRNR